MTNMNFKGRREKRKKGIVGDKPYQYQQPHTPLQKEKDDVVLPTTQQKRDFGCREALHALLKGR
jgi:hypothetical protein